MQITAPPDRKIVLVDGDITRQSVDALINAANSSLMGGGGVDGAIHRAGGPEILAQCRRLRETSLPDGLPTGQAVATTAGNLPAKFVIHTVGPIWRGGSAGEPELLASCYRESLARADELELETVAFPSISTGAFGYPVEQAAPIALRTVSEALRQAKHVREARFVLFGETVFQAYANAAQSIPSTYTSAADRKKSD